jgi:Rod binding domain-containing protein
MSDLAITSDGSLGAPGGNDTARLKRAAAQFEAAFLELLFKDLEERPIDDEPLLGGDSATSQFKGLHHRGLSERAAGGLGIADLVFKELSVRAGLAPPSIGRTQEKKP